MFSKYLPFSKRLLQLPLAHYGITPQFMHPLDVELQLDESPKATKRTKTVCTIGYPTYHTGPRHSILTMRECSSMRASTSQDSTFPTETTQNITGKWWECGKLWPNVREHTPPSCSIPRAQKSGLERWSTTRPSSSNAANSSN